MSLELLLAGLGRGRALRLQLFGGRGVAVPKGASEGAGLNIGPKLLPSL